MHNEERASEFREAVLGLFTGGIYGGVHTLSGHPLDTIKSKIQIQHNLFAKSSAFSVAKIMWANEGPRAFFHGCIPPLWGSMVYRGIMMSGYEYSFTYLDRNYTKESFLQREVLIGFRPMVAVAAVFASLSRVVLESPIEYAKVMGQTGQAWKFKDIYRGFQWQVLRSTALLIPIFSSLDIFRRKTDLLTTLPGNFIVTAGSSFAAYFICWPLETLKNLAQSGTPHAGATMKERIAFLGGYRGLYLGVWPGITAGGLRNGLGMVAMVYAQKWATKLGLRD